MSRSINRDLFRKIFSIHARETKANVQKRYALLQGMRLIFPWSLGSHGRTLQGKWQWRPTGEKAYQPRRKLPLPLTSIVVGVVSALLIVSYAFPSLSRSFSVWRSATWSLNSPCLSVNPFHSYRRKRGYSASQKISWNSISLTFYIIHENWASGFLAESHTHTSLYYKSLSHVIFARIVKIFSNI